MSEPLDPHKLPGITFYDAASGRNMRYVYPDSGHWLAGWIVVQNPSGEWMTLRKATVDDQCHINGAVVRAHHL